MFKIESYITPLILSYVDRYIKNIKPEDSQVSLWGGDVVFHNLDLRLDVLEKELNSPFSISSGHIHELKIHVPWTKLGSEPIVITINTIECTLKLKTYEDRMSESSSVSRTRSRRQDLATPPGYINSLLNKIASNISIVCNNAIFKYLEEDIVLSLNAKTVSLTSVDNNWQPAFTELTMPELVLRKLISVVDLTVCLDRCNAHGKIPTYQEPFLYRNSFSLRTSLSYSSLKSSQASKIRIDVHFPKLDFSLSDQQLPMFMRLFKLCLGLYLGEFKSKEKSTNKNPDAGSGSNFADQDENPESSETWATWAWSYVPSVLPVYWEDEEEKQKVLSEDHRNRILDVGIFIDRVTVTFKWAEIIRERNSYNPSRLRFRPFLTLRMQGCYLQTVSAGLYWVNVQGGISHVILEPVSECLCGMAEDPSFYLLQGCERTAYLQGCLFDPSSAENSNSTRDRILHWEHHMQSVTEATLLERTPAMGFDYLYKLELSDDFNSEFLSQLGSDLEYSNVPEKAILRLAVGPMQIKVSYGLCHRLSGLSAATQQYSYPEYAVAAAGEVEINDATVKELLDMENNLPSRVYQVAIMRPTVTVSLSPQHGVFDKHRLVEKRSLRPKTGSLLEFQSLPVIIATAVCLDVQFSRPMYPSRLVRTLRMMENPPSSLLQKAYSQLKMKSTDLSMRFVSQGKQISVLEPWSGSLLVQSLLLPELWKEPERVLSSTTLETGSLEFALSRPQLNYLLEVAQDLLGDSHHERNLQNLGQDSMNDVTFFALRSKLKDFRIHWVKTSAVACLCVSLAAADVTVENPYEKHPIMVKDRTEELFIDFLVQVPSHLIDPSESRIDPAQNRIDNVPVLNLRMESANITYHPQLLHWIHYEARKPPGAVLPPSEDLSSSHPSTHSLYARDSGLSSSLGGVTGLSSSALLTLAPRSLPETVPEKLKIDWNLILQEIQKSVFHVELQASSFTFGVNEYTRIVLSLPGVELSCAAAKTTKDNSNVPYSLQGKSTFPWNLSLKNFSISTCRILKVEPLLQPVSLTCTIALSPVTKPENVLDLCIHADVSAIHLGITVDQMDLICRILASFMSSSHMEPKEKSQAEAFQLSSLGLWMQIAIPRCVYELVGHNSKVEIDMEDLTTSVDLQDVYTKLSSKLTSFYVRNFIKIQDKWIPDPCTNGIVLTCGDEITRNFHFLSDKSDPLGFHHNCTPLPSPILADPNYGSNPYAGKPTGGVGSLTWTRAKRSHARKKWLDNVQTKDDEPPEENKDQDDPAPDRFLNEVNLSLEAFDVIITPGLLEHTGAFLESCRSLNFPAGPSLSYDEIPPPVSSHSLPLLFANTKPLRVFLVQPGKGFLLLNVESVDVTPRAENPLGRCCILQQDLFTEAANNGSLFVPGSDIEDRQYHIEVGGLSLGAGFCWSDVAKASWLSRIGNHTSSLHTMAENPALEWNVGEFFTKEIFLSPVLSRTDLRFIYAPSIHSLKEKCTVAGEMAEINIHGNLNIYVNLSFKEEFLKPWTELFQNFLEKIPRRAEDQSGDIKVPGSSSLANPHNLLITTGSINVFIYEDPSEGAEILPLVYARIEQPHFVSRVLENRDGQWELCLFNLKLQGPVGFGKLEKPLPAEVDFKQKFMETKPGIPDKNTGTPPSFFSMRKSSVRTVLEFGRPFLLNVRPTTLDDLGFLRIRLLESQDRLENDPDLGPGNWSYGELYMKTAQFVLKVFLEDNYKILAGFDALRVELEPDSEMFRSSFNVDSVTLKSEFNTTNSLMMDPWNVGGSVVVRWPQWLQKDRSWIQLAVAASNLKFHARPSDLELLEKLRKFQEAFLPKKGAVNTEGDRIEADGEAEDIPDAEQHYQDDLRAGAFQFQIRDPRNQCADSVIGHPEPYQVIFTVEPASMCWAYPQPRTLTRLDVYPIPLMKADIQESDSSVDCALQYWQESRKLFKTLRSFKLSESQLTRVRLPTAQDSADPVESIPHSVEPIPFSCMWRIVMNFTEDGIPESKPTSIIAAPPSLVACTRVDSYFNARLVPHIELSASLNELSVTLHNSTGRANGQMWDLFRQDQSLPAEFPSVVARLDNVHLDSSWNQSSNSGAVTSSGSFRISTLNFATLAEEFLINPSELRGSVLLDRDSVATSLECSSIQCNFSQTIYHSLMTTYATWNRDPGDRFPVFAPYIVLNDTQEALRIGQAETGESILLLPRQFHQYTWKFLEKKRKNKLQVCMEGSRWRWCEPCGLEKDGVHVRNVVENGEAFPLLFTIRTLDAVRKEVTVRGQVQVASLLPGVMEVKLIPQKEAPAQVREMRGQINSSSCAASFLFPLHHLQGIKLRLIGSNWSGMIPYAANNQSRPIVLVRVPQKDSDEDLNIWCHLWTEKINTKTNRLLILMSPLYMVRSHMPLSLRLHVKTPGAGSSQWIPVRGQGSDNILNCPGSVDHTHQLSLQLSPDLPESSPAIPLNWTMSSQYSGTSSQAAAKDSGPFIDDLLHQLFDRQRQHLPDAKDTSVPADSVVQPKTDVRITFSTLGPRCHTLLVELKPWALLTNQSGADLYLSSSSEQSHWLLPSGATLAPPPLPSTFQLGIYVNDAYFYSKPMLLQDQEVSGFMSYRPRMEGALPPEGFCCTQISFNRQVCFLTLLSTVQDGIRILTVKATFQVVNQTDANLCVGTLSRGKTCSLRDIQSSPLLENRIDARNAGPVPLLFWSAGNPELLEMTELYVSVRACGEWSCPVKLDLPACRNSNTCRTSFSVPLVPHTADETRCVTFPVTLTKIDESGIIVVTLSYDPVPLWIIINKTKHAVAFAQASDTRPGDIETHSEGFDWTGVVCPASSAHYTPPWANQRFPDLSPPSNMPRLLLSGLEEGQLTGWSSPLHPCLVYDQFVSLPHFSDVMVRVVKTGLPNQSAVIIEPVSRAEISAKEIRGRISEDVSARPLAIVPATMPDMKPLNNSAESTSCQWSCLHERAQETLRFNTVQTTAHKRTVLRLQEISVLLRDDSVSDCREVLRVTAEEVLVDFNPTSASLGVLVGSLQVDNQLYRADIEENVFDFPVVLLPQAYGTVRNGGTLTLADDYFLRMDFALNPLKWDVTSMEFRLEPVFICMEDKLHSALQAYFESYWSVNRVEPATSAPSTGRSFHLDRLVIHDITLDLSLRSSSTLYIALDHSPLTLKSFDRSFVITNSFRLGQSLAMHYISSALFKAGWVVGSLELLGSPTALARSVTSGLKDFVQLPYQGIWQGPRAFLAGILNGSSSLVTHVTAGTLTSVTQLASSVARNIDRLSCDAEFQHRSEEGRRKKPQSLAQGFGLGLNAFGISLLGAIGGLAHHPLESVLQDNASARNLAVGVTKGIIGVFAKPISGAADFVAHTGQGLLNASQWNAPFKAKYPGEILEQDSGNLTYGIARILWKIGDETPLSVHMEGSKIICCLEATKIRGLLETPPFQVVPVLLLVSTGTLCILNAPDGDVQAMFELQEVDIAPDKDDPTLITIAPIPATPSRENREEEFNPHYDQGRVAEFVRQTTPHVLPDWREEPAPGGDVGKAVVQVMVNANWKDYFLSCFRLAKQQKQGYGFFLM